MLFTRLFRSLKSGREWLTPRALRATARRARKRMPRLEMLEDRTVPSGGYLYRTFNIPNAGTGADQGTIGSDINNLGQVAGYFRDASLQIHGFLGSSSLTTLDDPNAGTITVAYGLNDQGQIVGSYLDGSTTYHGFLLSGGQYTTLDDPNAVTGGPFQGTEASGINAAGQIVGDFNDANSVGHGFLLSGGQYTTLDDPSAGTAAHQGTGPFGINAAGQIVGTYIDANNVEHGFLLSNGQYTTLDDPNAGTGAGTFQGTRAFGINAAGQIVGAYFDANSVRHGFLLSGGQYTTLDDPNAASIPEDIGTTPVGINDAGQIVGAYGDANDLDHGFLATPASSAGSRASVGGGSANGFLAEAALTNPTRPDHQGIDTAGNLGVNRDGLRGTAPSQPTIIATVPRTAHGSGQTGRVYVISATAIGAGKHPDPVASGFEQDTLWRLQ